MRVSKIKIVDTGEWSKVGHVSFDSDSKTVRFIPEKSLSREEKARARTKFFTAKDVLDSRSGVTYISPALKKVKPWTSFWGTFEALRDMLPMVGYDVDMGETEVPPDEADEPDLDLSIINAERAIEEEYEINRADAVREEYWESEDK